MVRARSKSNVELLTVHVTEAQLELLRKLDFPGTQEILATPVQGEEGLHLQVTRAALEDLAGWVAGQANHERSKRRAALLHHAADAMEFALGR